MKMKDVGVAGAAVALALTNVGVADSGDNLQSRLEAAEARIAELEARQSNNWLNEERAEQVRGLVADVLADADTRASLMQSGMTAGYQDGVMISSADGDWTMHTRLLMQQRFYYSTRDNNADDNVWDFENTRTKFRINGTVAGDWFYNVDVNIGSSARTGTVGAYLGYDYGNGMKVKVGHMKAPLLREELVDAEYQLAVERSNVNYAFTGGYADGIAVEYAMSDNMMGHLMISDGQNTGGSAFPATDTEFAITGRVDYLASGTWDQFMDFTSGDEEGLLIGGAFHWQKGESGTAAAIETEVLILTIDGSYEGEGWNAYGAFIYADVDPVAGAGTSPWGVVVQGGFYMQEDLEGFIRYEWADWDNTADDLSIITFGVNKYFAGHNAKWTTDFGFSTDQITSQGVGSSASPAAFTGWRTDAAGEDGQFLFRTQWQILF